MSAGAGAGAPPVAFPQALRLWALLGFINFGGPAGQIALMHRLLVEERRWISDARFLQALNFCMLLPGPEAQQLATYLGWQLHGVRGGIAAGTLFILPGFVLMCAIAALYVSFGEQLWLQGLLLGLQAVTLAIVVDALRRIGRRALRHRSLIGLAALSFIALAGWNLSFALLIVAAALIGLAGLRLAPQVFAAPAAEPAATASVPAWPLRVLLSGALLWGAPLLACVLLLGLGSVYTQQALFFSKMALLSFGGAYAVLTYMTQQAVQHYGWLSAHEMVQGLALAETTPGPLILVLSYVGFLGAHRDPGGLDPLLAGLAGASLSTWVSFVPCFVWIFLGAPQIERWRRHRGLHAALTAISAAVVGVIANLSLWYALQVLFAQVQTWHGPLGLRLPLPVLASVHLPSLMLAAAALLAMLRYRLSLPWTLAIGAVLGVAIRLLG